MHTDQTLLTRIMEEALSPLAGYLALHAVSGATTVVVFEPGSAGEELARAAGWDGQDSCFRLTEDALEGLLARCDWLTAATLRGPGRPGRIVVITQGTAIIFDDFKSTRWWPCCACPVEGVIPVSKSPGSTPS